MFQQQACVCLIIMTITCGIFGMPALVKQSARQRKITALEAEREGQKNRNEELKKELQSLKEKRAQLEMSAQSNTARTNTEQRKYGDLEGIEQIALAQGYDYVGRKVRQCGGSSYLLIHVGPAGQGLELYGLMETRTTDLKPAINGQATSQGNWEGTLTIAFPNTTVYGFTSSNDRISKVVAQKAPDDDTLAFSMRRIEGRWEFKPFMPGKDRRAEMMAQKATTIESAPSCDFVNKILMSPRR